MCITPLSSFQLKTKQKIKKKYKKMAYPCSGPSPSAMWSNGERHRQGQGAGRNPCEASMGVFDHEIVGRQEGQDQGRTQLPATPGGYPGSSGDRTLSN
jgi:hypothetical protein